MFALAIRSIGPLATAMIPLFIASCGRPHEDAPQETPAAESTPVATTEAERSVVRINSTQQSWNPWQPWEKNRPTKRRALAAIIAPGQVVTTAELVADATYLELESIDGTRFARAKVEAIDYEANLALLAPFNEREGEAIFEGIRPMRIADPSPAGSQLQVLQIEENGVPILTEGVLQSVELAEGFLANHSFLTYKLKASMRSVASSFSLPVLINGALAGLLVSYSQEDQLSDVISTDVLRRFLDDAADGNYRGFPMLGVSVARTEDSSFRQWLKLDGHDGGLFIQSVRKQGAADIAGLRKGDVLLAVDGMTIDRRGYYRHPLYGSIPWGHLIRGSKSTDEVVKLSLLRDGSPLDLEATLIREEESDRLVPNHVFGAGPNYLVKGGMIFQELTLPLLQSFGDDWRSRAPLELLDTLQYPEKYSDRMDRVVFLSGVIPTPATVGYEQLRNLIIDKVNGREIRHISDLIEAFGKTEASIHSIEFANEQLTVHLDQALASAVDAELVRRGIPQLSRGNEH
jgi:S1-C subfamily serine protease